MKTIPPKRTGNNSIPFFSLVIVSLALLALYSSGSDSTPSCAQQPPFIPAPNPALDDHYSGYLQSDTYSAALIERFAGAIRIPTVSYDYMRGGPNPLPQDPVPHKPFLDLHAHFLKSYPLLHSALQRIVVNEYALLYVWKGSDTTLKPMMFMAHQDVVPVDPTTADEWLHAPFSGDRDDEFVYGRGATDTKMTVVSILEAVENLLSLNFQPKRTLLIAFGHDEEISGFNGAKRIVDYIQHDLGYGNNGIEFILDEGLGATIFPDRKKSQSLQNVDQLDLNSNIQDGSKRVLSERSKRVPGQEVMLIEVSEKGYMDLNITISINVGGHSSLPPDHTGIGIMSQIITTLEDHPYQSELLDSNPILSHLACVAEYTDTLTWYEKLILKHWKLLKRLVLYGLSKDPFLKASVTTTQAVDVIHGGVKVNALPQQVYALVNQRIAPHETEQDVIDRLISLVEPIAKQNSLDFEWSSESQDILKRQFTSSKGKVSLAFEGLEPSPTSPTDSFAFQRLSGTLRNVHGAQTIVAPTIMVANTDTRWTWNLTPNIFRMIPIVWQGDEGIHTVNEKARIVSVVKTVGFYYQLIRSFNE
ncbi:hypothetical protein HDV02_001261 [Globomyces sp. JEL0801]|nr:hypothetical protein HDV02_001261 [Globomyces sp. JEL0801]